VITSSETIRTSGKQKRRRLLTIALTAAVAAGAIGFVVLKWGQNGPYAYRHQVQLWPNPDPIDGSSSNLTYPIAFSPDGRVAMAKDNRDRILILDPSTGQITRIFSGGGDNLVASLAFTKDGRSIVSAGAVGQMNVRDVATGDLLRTFQLSEKTPVVEQSANVTTTTYPCSDVLISQNGNKVVCKDNDKKLLEIWKVETGHLDVTLTGIAEQNVLAFSPAGNVLALADLSHKVSLRRIQSPANRPLFDAAPGFPVHACFSPDETILATGCGREIEFWATSSGSRLRTFSLGKRAPPDADITSLAFSSDGTTLAVGAEWRVDTWRNAILGKSELWRESRGCVALWNVASGTPIGAVYPKSDVSKIALSPAADSLAVGSWEGTMTLWQRSPRSSEHEPIGETSNERAVKARLSSATPAALPSRPSSVQEPGD
jgi:WD40 repeat protein